jgi:hypothetical protein
MVSGLDTVLAVRSVSDLCNFNNVTRYYLGFSVRDGRETCDAQFQDLCGVSGDNSHTTHDLCGPVFSQTDLMLDVIAKSTAFSA